MTRTREDLAWLAGFWDGEGSVSVDGRTMRPLFTLTQAGAEGEALCWRVLKSCELRGAVYPQPAQSKRPGRNQPYWRVQVGGHERVQALLAMCWPWLSETKRKQATVALGRFRQRKSEYRHHHRIKTHCPQGHPYDEANTYVDWNGERYKRKCRACRRAGYHRAKAASRAEDTGGE